MRFKNRAWGPGARLSNTSRVPGRRPSCGTSCECGPFFGPPEPALPGACSHFPDALLERPAGTSGANPDRLTTVESQNGRATGKNVSGGNGVALAVETPLTRADLQAFGAAEMARGSTGSPRACG